MSLARLCRIALAAEAILAAAIAWAITQWLGLAASAAIGCVLATVLGLRLALVVIAHGVGECFNRPRPEGLRIGLRQALRLISDEWVAVLRANLWSVPFASAARLGTPGQEQPVLLLVHGYLSNAATLEPLAVGLREAGLTRLHSLDYPSIGFGIREAVPYLNRAIDEALAISGAKQVVLVCHSMGGLVARYAIALGEHRRVRQLITIGTPHHGTGLARLGVGNGPRMRIGGSVFAELTDLEQKAPRVPMLSILSAHDTLVAPYASAHFPGATNEVLPGVGHLALLASPQVHAWVARAVK
jgi:pimeloyl-ACP methyl ester carboxylesterase